ncbi:MAG: S41 family peptidase [Bacteroidales bacterium]
MKLEKIIVAVIVLFMFTGCQNQSQKVQNIKTFAKLYGYVRWFHPSDEAQEIDWDKFAILGVQKVENVKSELALKDTLLKLFSPIVQGLKISTGKNTTPIDLHSLISDTTANKVVAWQHYGVNLGQKSNVYKSIRTNKIFNDSYSYFYKNILDVSILRGKEIKLTGYFKNKPVGYQGETSLFLVPITKNEQLLNFSSLISQHKVEINSMDWRKFEMTTKIGYDSEYLVFGGTVKDNVSVLADDFSLFVKEGDRWEVIDSFNMDFEQGLINTNINDWQITENGHKIELSENEIHSGRFALRADYTGKLFEEYPYFGEVINEPIGNNLHCIIPLALYSIDNETYPKSDIKSLNKLKKELAGINISSDFNTHTNLACVVISWNVFQHFYPYFDVVKTNWAHVLSEIIEKTYSDKDNKDFTRTLSKMVAKLKDGHGFVYGERMYHLPVRTALVEDEIVITASDDPQLKTGDIIKKVNGVDAKKVLEDTKNNISGSSQLKRFRALNIFGSNYEPGSTNLVVVRDGEKILCDIQNKRSIKSVFYNPINNNPYQYDDIKELESGVYYVNLSKCNPEIFEDKTGSLANAKSVIYDYRWGVKLSLLEVIPHLIKTPVNSAWWYVPQIIYPDRKGMEFSESNWSLNPKKPYFHSKSIIITAPNVVSSGETEMGIIDQYHLGVTVGDTTAGCNGNVNFINLPNGFQIMWTGMKILKHDKTQHHLIGYQPDYLAQRTLLGIKKGRDEVLEKAIEIAKMN